MKNINYRYSLLTFLFVYYLDFALQIFIPPVVYAVQNYSALVASVFVAPLAYTLGLLLFRRLLRREEFSKAWGVLHGLTMSFVVELRMVDLRTLYRQIIVLAEHSTPNNEDFGIGQPLQRLNFEGYAHAFTPFFLILFFVWILKKSKRDSMAILVIVSLLYLILPPVLDSQVLRIQALNSHNIQESTETTQ